MDDNYDLSNLDKTVALGSNTLELPSGSNLTDILLEDLLDLEDSESVVIDENGYYKFQKSSSIDDVNDINMETIYLSSGSEPTPYYINISNLSLPQLPLGMPDAVIDQAFEQAWKEIPEKIVSEGRISLFEYETELDKDVVWLDFVETDTDGDNSSMLIHINLSQNVSKIVTKVSSMLVKLPAFLEMTLSDSNNNVYEVNADGYYELKDVPSTGIDLKLSIKGLKNFSNKKEADAVDYLTIQNQKVMMQGEAYTTMTINRDTDINKENLKTVLKQEAVDNAQLEALTAIRQIVITGAKGRFNPEINVKSSSVELTDLPDFLTDERVVADLYNPQIIFTADNNMPLAGYVTAKLVAKMNDGTVTKTINVPQFKLELGKNKICISRRQENIPADANQTIIVEDLSEIISTKVPDKIDLEVQAVADSENTYEVKFGKPYSVTDIEYNITAPLAFGSKARIVYSDDIDGWAEDMPEDIDFENGAYIEMNASIESNVPAYLNVSAKAIDVNKNEIDNVTVQVDNTITGSADGSSFVSTPVKIIIKEKNQKGALKSVDGIHLSLEATPSEDGSNPIVGKVLNATQNKLRVNDIKITVHGRVIADLN